MRIAGGIELCQRKKGPGKGRWEDKTFKCQKCGLILKPRSAKVIFRYLFKKKKTFLLRTT